MGERVCATCEKAIPVFCPPPYCDRMEGIDAQFGGVDCSKWQARANDRDQRYAKLEQVARNLFRYVDGVLNKNWAFSLPSDIDVFRKELENLGVDVYDY